MLMGIQDVHKPFFKLGPSRELAFHCHHHLLGQFDAGLVSGRDQVLLGLLAANSSTASIESSKLPFQWVSRMPQRRSTTLYLLWYGG